MSRGSLKLLLTFSVVAVLAAIGAPALIAATSDNDDSISPANTAFTANLAPGTTAVYSATLSGITVTTTCRTSSLAGTTPATGLIAFKISPPTYSNCTDSLGGTDTVTTKGKWALAFKDAPNDESGEKPGDKLNLTIPKAGATLTSSAAPGCVITVAPSAPAKITATYDDVNTGKYTNVSIPFATNSACPGGATTGTATFNATYVSTPGFHDVS